MTEITKELKVIEKGTGVEATIIIVDKPNDEVWMINVNQQIGVFSYKYFWNCFMLKKPSK